MEKQEALSLTGKAKFALAQQLIKVELLIELYSEEDVSSIDALVQNMVAERSVKSVHFGGAQPHATISDVIVTSVTYTKDGNVSVKLKATDCTINSTQHLLLQTVEVGSFVVVL